MCLLILVNRVVVINLITALVSWIRSHHCGRSGSLSLSLSRSRCSDGRASPGGTWTCCDLLRKTLKVLRRKLARLREQRFFTLGVRARRWRGNCGNESFCGEAISGFFSFLWPAMLKMDSLSDFNSWRSSISAGRRRGDEQYGALDEQPAAARNCSRLLISIH